METTYDRLYKKGKINQVILDQIIYLYQNEKLGRNKIGKQFDIDEKTIKKLLIENNIHIRTHQEANEIIANNRKYKCNEDYFKIESHNMAWLLGFTSADGCVDDRNRITWLLSNKDAEILEKIKKELNCEDNVCVKSYTDSNGHDVCRLSITSKTICQDLAKYNIVPRKTFKLTFPVNLAKEYWLDYIRGYWDGDGWVSRNYHSTIWGIVAAKKEVLEVISDFFTEFGITKREIYTRTREQSTTYYLQYNTRDSRKIYKLLYSDNNNLRLQRKFEHFTEIYNQYNGRPELLK